MHGVIDLDALLEAQSSDEDDDLPELDRTIEDILNDADDGELDDQIVQLPAVKPKDSDFREAEKDRDLHRLPSTDRAKSRVSENGLKLPRIWEAPLTPSPVLRPGAALAAATAASRQFVSPRRLEFTSRSKSSSTEDSNTETYETLASDGALEDFSVEDRPLEQSTSFVIIKEPDEPDVEADPENKVGDIEHVEHEIEHDEHELEHAEHENEREAIAEHEAEEILVAESSSSSDLEVVEFTETRSYASSSSETSDVGKDVEDELVAMSPLDTAEELEKRAANSGLFLEEGAAAQPMQLEGIQRGPPAIGLLELDWGGPVSFALSASEIMRDHGNPRALAVHNNYIAVGMSKGTVLLSASRISGSDDSELKVLTADKSHASVTVLRFSNLWDLLLVGYLNGVVALWDVTKAAVVKAVAGEHHNAIVHAAFVGQDASTGRQLKAITADCKGVVKLHTFTLVPLLRRYSVTSQCFLDGQRGIVLSLALLAITGLPQHGNDAGRKFLYDSSSDEAGGLVVFVTQQIVLVFRFTDMLPALEAKLTRPEGVREGSIPYTSWKAAEKDSTSENAYPLLALAWGRKVLVLQLQKTELKTLAEWEIDSKATGVVWLGDMMLVVATAKAELFLFTKEGLELERTAIRGADGHAEALAFHTYFLETCNNPEKVYANSLGVRGAALYVLGASRLWRARLLPWQDRIKVLQDAGDWMGAFQIAMELFDGRARGVTGLPSGLVAMQNAIMPNLLGLLSSYVDEAFAYVHLALGVSDNISGATREQYARVGRVAIEFCVHIGRTDVLFENVFKKFSDVGQAGTFLELLEPYILKDMLCGLAPEIMQSLVEHYSSKGWLQRVEQCILHMDIASLDFDQVMRLCRDHGLFSAIIYLFNKGLNDFKSPMDELLAAAQDQSRDNAQSFGYKLLVYLKYCFSGLAFPPGRGALSSTHLYELKKELLEYLLDPAGSGAETLYAVFPRLHYLLNLDVVATLEVFSLALVNEKFDRSNTEKELLQLTIDALVHIVETVLCMDIGSKDTTDHILLFIARFVSTGDACIPPTTLHRILGMLINAQQASWEDMTISVLKAVPENDWEPEKVLEAADEACFWQVSALVYTRNKDYVSALNRHLKDPSRPCHTFSYVISKLDPENGLKQKDFIEFREAVKSRIPQLVEQDSTAALFVILQYFGEEVNQVIQNLDPFPAALFGFLRSVLEIQSYSSRDSEAEAIEDYPWNDRSRLSSLLDSSHLEVTDEMVELYIELLCRFDPQKVLDFLRSYENYRVEKCLKLCQKYGVKDGAAFLLEHVGDVGSALTLVLSDLSKLFHELDSAVAANFSASNTLEERAVFDVKNAAVSLCQRNTFRLDPNEAESLWFHLLDRFVHPLQALAHDNVSSRSTTEKPSHYGWRVLHADGALLLLRKILSKSAEEVVTGMIGYVPVQVILNKIVSDYGNHELGDFKAAILEMLSAYGYELALLDAAKRIIEADMFLKVETLKHGRSRGVGSRFLQCNVCSSGFEENGSSKGAVQVFACGHLVHLSCKDELKANSNHVRCPVCVQNEELSPAPSPNATLSLAGKRPQQQQDHPARIPTPQRNGAASRFEILKSLGKGSSLPEMTMDLRLKLSPPVVYRHKHSVPQHASSSSITIVSNNSSSLFTNKRLTHKLRGPQKKNRH